MTAEPEFAAPPLSGPTAAHRLAMWRDAPDSITPFTVHPTGFDPLDQTLDGGLRAGDLTLVGGIPGVGKTVATLQWARYAAAAGTSAVYVSYEHDPDMLLARLLTVELGELGEDEVDSSGDAMRGLVRSVARGELRLEDATAGNLRMRAACGSLSSYAERLWLVRASGTDTGIDHLRGLVERLEPPVVLFIDYLQKIPTDAVRDPVASICQGLKDIALDRHAAVVAVVAGHRTSLGVRRLQLHHLRGAGALAYESDLIILLNDKFPAVSKLHTSFDPVRAARFHRQVVFSIEKNRDGQAGIVMEFDKDFRNYRFHPIGGFVEERLIDDWIYTE